MWGILLLYFSYCLVQSAIALAFKIVSEHKEKIYFKSGLLLFMNAMILTVCSLKNLDVINSLLSIILTFILYYFLFRKSLKETIYYGFVIWLFGMLLDIVIMLKAVMFPINIDFHLMRILDTLIMDILLIAIACIKPLRKMLRKFYKKIEKLGFSYLKIGYIILIIVAMTYTLLDTIVNGTISNSIIVLVILVFPLIFLYINKEYTIFSLNQTNKQLIKNNEFYMELMNEYRILKHNLIHQLNGVKSVSNKKSIMLIEDIIKDYYENAHNLPNINKMPVGINGLVYEKIYTFNDKNLKLGIDNKIETNIFDKLAPRSYNLLCEALGILLDNALDATSKSKEKILIINLNENDKKYNIKIINTFSNMLDIDQIGNISYTTKANGHGIGLFSLLGKRKIKIKTTIINNLFQSEILIEKKN